MQCKHGNPQKESGHDRKKKKRLLGGGRSCNDKGMNGWKKRIRRREKQGPDHGDTLLFIGGTESTVMRIGNLPKKGT